MDLDTAECEELCIAPQCRKERTELPEIHSCNLIKQVSHGTISDMMGPFRETIGIHDTSLVNHCYSRNDTMIGMQPRNVFQ